VSIRSFRDIYWDGLFGVAAFLDWSSIWFMAGVNEKVEFFYTMLMKVILCSIRNNRDVDYNVYHENINRVRGDRLWILQVQKRKYADGLVVMYH
jgi:hypothetical protein